MNGRVETRNICCGVSCDNKGIITKTGTAPILGKFIGQPKINLEIWIFRNSGKIKWYSAY